MWRITTFQHVSQPARAHHNPHLNVKWQSSSRVNAILLYTLPLMRSIVWWWFGGLETITIYKIIWWKRKQHSNLHYFKFPTTFFFKMQIRLLIGEICTSWSSTIDAGRTILCYWPFHFYIIIVINVVKERGRQSLSTWWEIYLATLHSPLYALNASIYSKKFPESCSTVVDVYTRHTLTQQQQAAHSGKKGFRHYSAHRLVKLSQEKSRSSARQVWIEPAGLAYIVDSTNLITLTQRIANFEMKGVHCWLYDE